MTQNRPPPRKLLIVVNFFDGDHDQAATLCHLLADLESVKSPYADILLYRRSDARPMEEEVRSKLLTRFANVHQLKCRRLNAVGYPLGPNEMFCDLLEAIRAPQWKSAYYAFYNMEADCVPLCHNWIQLLADEYKKTYEDGVYAIGHICDKPMEHLNGASVYAIDLFDRAGGMDLLGGPSHIAYDFYHAKRILPVSKDSSLIMLDFNRKTITSDDLFGVRKNGVKPVIFHGVKDQSAIIAVRSKLIDRNPQIRDLSDRTIFTYYEPIPGFNEQQERECLDIWKEAWAAAGWNPVVNERRDAQKNARYEAVYNKISKLSGVRHDSTDIACYMRWLALEYVGGGLHCDYDVLPWSDFHPEAFARNSGTFLFQKNIPSLVMIDRYSLGFVFDGINEIKPSMLFIPDDKLIIDTGFKSIVKDFGERGWKKAKAVHFRTEACKKYSPGSPKSRIMLNFYHNRIDD